MDEFQAQLGQLVNDGSPVRRTNRAGADTKGTRLIDGIPGLQVTVYYDYP